MSEYVPLLDIIKSFHYRLFYFFGKFISPIFGLFVGKYLLYFQQK